MIVNNWMMRQAIQSLAILVADWHEQCSNDKEKNRYKVILEALETILQRSE